MSTYDPRILIQALEDLYDEIARWSGEASETLTSATYTQRQVKEAVDRDVHHAAVVLDRAKQNEESVQEAAAVVARTIERSAEAKSLSHETLSEVQSTLEAAAGALRTWEGELAKALAWLARAKARLAKAKQELASAQKALAQANWELEQAVAAYNACMNDKSRNNCNREANAFRAAQVAVQKATLRVKLAEEEVEAAEKEVEEAEARVACCKRAVEYTKQAVSLAQEAEKDAIEAVNTAERSLELAQAAKRTVSDALEKVAAEIETATYMVADVHAALTHTDDAFIHMKSADQAEASTQRYSSSVRQELKNRIQSLNEFNRTMQVTG